MRPSNPPFSGLEHLKKMSLGELQELAEDMRQMIISACLKNGGHLGASLGAVDLAIALHFVFDSPREPLVWDVGHQAYAHKLLTGRWDRFHTLRTSGGISGFLSREESEHDVFGAGHCSTALSAALAMAYARAGTDCWTVGVVGDGGLTAGMALEALNNAHVADGAPFLLVLNDNQMSISPNVGALPAIFASGEVKQYFELFGFEYIGPVNGHHLGELIRTLQALRSDKARKPILLHVHTQKGKGYVPAEESPAAYHGISPVLEKVPGAPEQPQKKTYSETFGEALTALAGRDEKIVAITAAMPEGTGLAEFARKYPHRFFDVGIAEPHAVAFAAGLATQGFKPVVAIYSTFLQRGIDAMIHDVALQKLGVTFAVDRAGVVGADGPTHHGMFDLAYCGMIPGMTISAPTSLADVASELELAVNSGAPWVIRYPRGSGPDHLEGEPLTSEAGGALWLRRAVRPRLIAVGLGSAASRVVAAANAVDPSAAKISVISVIRAKPIAAVLVNAINALPDAVVLVVEDGIARGGFGQDLIASLASRVASAQAVGYGDAFLPHGSPLELEQAAGLSTQALAARMQKMLQNEETN